MDYAAREAPGRATPAAGAEPRSSFADPAAPLSLFPSAEPVPPGSALRQELRRPVTAARHKGYASTPGDSARRVQDKPVTFHSRIRSSGYGAERPAMQLGVSRRAQEKAAKLRQRRQAKARAMRALSHEYPMGCTALTVPQPQHRFEPDAARGDLPPIHSVSFSEDATLLATASADGGVRVYRLPIAQHRRRRSVLAAHAGRALDARFSHCGKLLISAGAEGRALVWRLGKADPVVDVRTAQRSVPRLGSARHRSGGNPKERATARAAAQRGGSSEQRSSSVEQKSDGWEQGGGNVALRGEVCFASFFHLDRLLVAASGPQLLAFSYHCEDEKEQNDLKRLSSSGRYKQALSWTAPARAITAADALNATPSHLLFAAASNRSIYVYDAAHGQLVREVRDAHARPPHSIVLPRPSGAVPLAGDAYNVFLTAAADGIAALWDLRAPTVAAHFCAHANRREKVGLAFSPCMRYAAVGSEDRVARLWDLRCSSDRTEGMPLPPSGDVVGALAFNPLHPQLALASFDGACSFFTCRSVAA